MARIQTIEAQLYRIPLTVTLSDSTHGEINAFELITIRRESILATDFR